MYRVCVMEMPLIRQVLQRIRHRHHSPVLTFKEFIVRKSKDQLDRNESISFRPKKLKKELIEKEVTINIGLTNHSSYGDTYKVRGKILPFKVGMYSSAENILKLAMQKRKNYDRSFRSDQNYHFAYQDGRKVETIPGSEKFTLSKYKEDLGIGQAILSNNVCILQTH